MTLGTDNDITIVRSIIDGDPPMLNRSAVLNFMMECVLQACECYCSATENLYVFINSDPLEMYMNLTAVTKCIFIQQYQCDSDGEEYDYETEDNKEDSSVDSSNVIEKEEMEMELVQDIRRAIELCDKERPILVSPCSWSDKGASTVSDILVINLLDADCDAWLPSEYRPLLSTVMEFDLKTSNVYKLTRQIRIEGNLPSVICTNGLNSYLRDILH